MNVAVIHDHFLHIGGAEKVLFALLNIFPTADVYTALITQTNAEIIKQKTSGKIFVSWFNKINLTETTANLFKPFINTYGESLDLTQYDLVISSSHSFSAKSVITHPNTLHISYIHPSPRYLYTEYNETRGINKGILKTLFSPFKTWLRMQDFLGAQRPDVLIANSKAVQTRIRKYDRRESKVIYPPISIPKQVNFKKEKKYYLCVSRLVKQKGTELAIKAANKLKFPLVIVGEGNKKNYLHSISGKTITFKGFVSETELTNIYAHAKALIYCSIDEDFGMVPVEALAHGVPVVAYNSGGVQETVIHGQTGILFDKFTTEALEKAIIEFERRDFTSKNCRKLTERFSEAMFKLKFKFLIAHFPKYSSDTI